MNPTENSPSKAHDRKYEIYAVVTSVGTDSISTKCEVNETNYFGSDCLAQLQPDMCVEVKSSEDPSSTNTITAVEIEVKGQSKCMAGMEKESTHAEIKGAVSSVNKQNGTFTVDGRVITVTDTTFCEYFGTYYVGSDCIDNLQSGWMVEVKVNSSKEALKIETES